MKMDEAALRILDAAACYTVRLRGHHGLCLLTTQGDALEEHGYPPGFAPNLRHIVGHLNASLQATGGFMIEFVAGRNDLCASMCPGAHCESKHVLPLRDKRAAIRLTGVVSRHGFAPLIFPSPPPSCRVSGAAIVAAPCHRPASCPVA